MANQSNSNTNSNKHSNKLEGHNQYTENDRQGNQGNQGKQHQQQGHQGQQQQGSGTSNRGFASMDPDRQREIASEGGKAAHASGNAHEFTPEEAREAGRQSHKNDGNNQHYQSQGNNKQHTQSNSTNNKQHSQSNSSNSKQHSHSGGRGGNNANQARDSEGQFTSKNKQDR